MFPNYIPAQQYVSAWAESLDGLWQWQQMDFSLEQAFNSLVSKDNKRCCVCTLLAPDDTFKPLDREKLMKIYCKASMAKGCVSVHLQIITLVLTALENSSIQQYTPVNTAMNLLVIQ